MIAEAKLWDIHSYGLNDLGHRAVSVYLKREAIEKGPGRWRISPLDMKLIKHLDKCSEIINKPIDNASGDIFEQWDQVKFLTRSYLRVEEFDACTEKGQRAKSLAKRRRKLWTRRKPDLPDPDLENEIVAVEEQEGALAEWTYLNYSYNAMAKYSLLGENPTKWFFNRVKAEGHTGLEALRDEDGTLHSEVRGLLRIAGSVYKNLYSTKESDAVAREELLDGMNRKIRRTYENV